MLSSASGMGIFVAKYNIDGTLAWAKAAGGGAGARDRGYDIATLADGSSLAISDGKSPIRILHLKILRQQLADLGLDW